MESNCINQSKRIKGVCIGAGNVASVLAEALSPYVDFIQVFSRTEKSAELLGVKLGCQSIITDFSKLMIDADFYMVSLNDSALSKIDNKISLRNNAIWVHTSGTIPGTILQSFSKNFGVFYPLQTFTKGRKMDLSNIPFFIEGSNNYTISILKGMVSCISENVYEADDSLRTYLHIAGVISCNFTTMLLNITEQLLTSKGIPLKVVEPLVRETINKSFATSPRLAQTGPAQRGDLNIIKKHLEYLEGESRDLYLLLSQIILKEFGNEQNQL